MLISDGGDDRDGVMSPEIQSRRRSADQHDLDVAAEMTEIPDGNIRQKIGKIFFVKTSNAGVTGMTDGILWVARGIVRLILTDC